MLDPATQAKIHDDNAIYYGYPLERLMENAGKGVARSIASQFSQDANILILCGPGNNGGDGLVAARYLKKYGFTPVVYLVPAIESVRSELARNNWNRFSGEKYNNIEADDVSNGWDVVVECLFGTGVSGKLKEPYNSLIQKVNKLKAKKISVDLPIPGYRPDKVISLMTQKTTGAEVVDIGYPKWLQERIGSGEVKALHQPRSDSHKGENGQLLIVAGNQRYHGAVKLATSVASKIVDLVFVSSTELNNQLIKKMKSELAEFIPLEREEIKENIKRMNAVLLGPGLGMNEDTQRLVNDTVSRHKKTTFVLDADALAVLRPELLRSNCIVTPHREEFQKLFGCRPTKKNLLRMSQKYNGCVIVLKGDPDHVVAGEEIKKNVNGNAGMTKGGTGDVLAGLIAGLATRNDPFLAAQAGVFLNGKAADSLAGRVSHYYSAGDLVKEIPKTLKRFQG